MLDTTVLIRPTAHSRGIRGGVINITTTAARLAPPAATADAPPTALNAAAPAAPLLAGSVMIALEGKWIVSLLRRAGSDVGCFASCRYARIVIQNRGVPSDSGASASETSASRTIAATRNVPASAISASRRF